MNRHHVILILATAGTVAFFYFNVEMSEFVHALRGISAFDIALQLVLSLASVLLAALFTRRSLQTLGIRLNFKEWFGLSAINSMFNVFLPLRAGSVFKAVYLKTKYDFKIAHSAAVMAASTAISAVVVMLSAALFFGFISMTDPFRYSWSSSAAWFAFVCSLAGFFAVLLPLRLAPVIEKMRWLPAAPKRIIDLLIAGSAALARDRGLVIFVTINELLVLLLDIVRLEFAYQAVDAHVSISAVMTVNFASAVSAFIALTPGNIGVQEVIVTAASGIIGMTTEQGLASASLIRVAMIIVVAGLGATYLWILRKSLPR